MSNELPTMLKLSKIVVGYNPRRFFDPVKHGELVASIKRQGVLQSLLVRPGDVEDTFVLVCGGRRYKAALEALGPDGEVPAVIRQMTDQEALDAAASENEERDNTSETEQADAAVRMLAACGGDKAETARRLGWSTTKLARRLALAELADGVKLALDERRIKVGHAELLAAVPSDKQEKALETILAANLDVAKTRELLMKVTQDLAHACFDKSECTTCPFNSGTQRALFETHVDDGHCTNAACFTLKTEAAEQAAAAEAEAAAAKAAEAAPATAAALASEADGSDEVGAENNGEDVSDETSDDAAPVAADVETTGDASTTPATVATPTATPTPATRVKGSVPSTGPAVTARSLAARAKTLREGTWRTALARHIAQDTSNAWQVLLIAAYSGTIVEINRDTLRTRADVLITQGFRDSNMADKISLVRKLSSTEAATALSAIGAAYAKDVTSFDTVRALAEAFEVDIRGLWQVNQAFLELYTKDELKFIAQETGLVEHMGTKPFGKLLGSKKADLIAGMLNATGFDWAGRLPSAMTLNGAYGPPPQTAEADAPAAAEPSDNVGADPQPSEESPVEPVAEVLPAEVSDVAEEGDPIETDANAAHEPALPIDSAEEPSLPLAATSAEEDDGFGDTFFGEPLQPLPHAA